MGMKASNTSLGTNESPNYGASDTITSLSIGGILFALTVGSMVVFADTIIGELVIGLYEFLPIVGMLVVGGILSLGYYVTMKGLKNDSNMVALFGSLITVFAYGAFGAGILSPYATEIYNEAILLAGGVTGVIGLIAATVVYSTDKSFQSWGAKSGKTFLFAILAVAGGSFIPGSIGALLVGVGFVLVLIGFIIDLVYEIWQVASGNRTPIENGFGLYVAFTGVFVHILQIALEAMADQ